MSCPVVKVSSGKHDSSTTHDMMIRVLGCFECSFGGMFYDFQKFLEPLGLKHRHKDKQRDSRGLHIEVFFQLTNYLLVMKTIGKQFKNISQIVKKFHDFPQALGGPIEA